MKVFRFYQGNPNSAGFGLEVHQTAPLSLGAADPAWIEARFTPALELSVKAVLEGRAPTDRAETVAVLLNMVCHLRGALQDDDYWALLNVVADLQARELIDLHGGKAGLLALARQLEGRPN